MSFNRQQLVLLLGTLGLAPFIALPILSKLSPQFSYFSTLVFAYYSACILCFLAGTLWQEASTGFVVVSNVLTLWAVSCLVLYNFNSGMALLLLALGFLVMLLLDMNRALPAWYIRFRRSLTIVVIAMHIVSSYGVIL
jgi:hypothetical protein